MFGSAPDFWWHADLTLAARLLSPAGRIYGAIARRRMERDGVRPAVPVICIGNFTAGGAGKTPAAIAIAGLLRAKGHAPAFLSRGYGRRRSNAAVIAVDAACHTSEDVGDEPLLLARHAPTFVAADRALGAAAATAAGASVLLMDDGLQNAALVKAASLSVVDAARGIGNGLCIPAGPLRAPLPAQWPHVSLLCVIGESLAAERLGAEAARRHIPVVKARIEPDALALESLKGHRLYAFSGIGHPAKFFATLEACGLDVVARRAFPDHHVFSADERRQLVKDAMLVGAELVTTEKDRTRLPQRFMTHVLPIRLVFDDDKAALDAVLDRIAKEALNRS